MERGKEEDVEALRCIAAQKRREAWALDEKADALQEELSIHDAAEANEDETVETLGYVWESPLALEFEYSPENTKRRLYGSNYDPEVARGCRGITDAIEVLRQWYGGRLMIPEVAATLLDGGVCNSRMETRSLRINSVRSKVYRYVKHSASWERCGENVMRFVGPDGGMETEKGG